MNFKVFVFLFLAGTSATYGQNDTTYAKKFMSYFLYDMKKGVDLSKYISPSYHYLTGTSTKDSIYHYTFDEFQIISCEEKSEVVISNDGQRNQLSLDYTACKVATSFKGKSGANLLFKIESEGSTLYVFPDTKSYDKILPAWHESHWVSEAFDERDLNYSSEQQVVLNFLWELKNPTGNNLVDKYISSTYLPNYGLSKVDSYSYDFFSLIEVKYPYVIAYIGYERKTTPKMLVFEIDQLIDGLRLIPGKINMGYVQAWKSEVKSNSRNRIIQYKNVEAIIADTTIFGTYVFSDFIFGKGEYRTKLTLNVDSSFTQSVEIDGSINTYDGGFTIKNNVLRLNSIDLSSISPYLTNEYYIVPWGKRLYLLSENRLSSSANDTKNDFVELADSYMDNLDAHRYNLRQLLKEQHEFIPVSGKPNFPNKWKHLLK